MFIFKGEEFDLKRDLIKE